MEQSLLSWWISHLDVSDFCFRFFLDFLDGFPTTLFANIPTQLFQATDNPE
jgi:hypothetical protein